MRLLIYAGLLFSAVFWNVENYFDFHNDGVSVSDEEFSSFGARHWNKKKFEAKTLLIGKTLLWCGRPEVVGLAEVENSSVLRRLCNGDILRKCGYKWIHYDSNDPRGIDVALMYLPDSLEMVRHYTLRPPFPTRDILYVCLKQRSTGEFWHFFVNHHPSKYGGKESGEKRMAVMRVLRQSVDSLVKAGQRNIVAMGDFNDTPDGGAFGIICGNRAEGGKCRPGPLVNLGEELISPGHSVTNQAGTIRYQGKWQLIDNFLVSPRVAENMKMTILKPQFLLERDRTWPGEKPRRTYLGPRYNGGVSDHLPIRLETPTR